MQKEYIETRITKRNINVEPFMGEIMKVIDTFVTTTNGVTTTKTNIIYTTLENVEKVNGLETISRDVFIEDAYNNKACVCMIKKENWDLLFQAKKHISEIVEYFDSTIYNEDEYMLVLFNFSSYELFDLNKEYIPIPIHIDYDYSNGRMSNGKYDLEKVKKILKDKDIILGVNKYGDDIETLEITNIPYYNATEHNYCELNFWFVPSKELYTKAQKLNSFEKSIYMFLNTFNVKLEDILIYNGCDD